VARPFRYTFILSLVAAGAALAAVGGWRYARASAPVSGPIILISIDALRTDRLPLYGYTAVQTPTIDALGRDGVVFERFYSHVPQSLPAHASMFSGRLPFETGVRDGAGFALNDRERTLAEVLSDRDYATGAVVSSYALRRATGIAQGFAFFDDDIGKEEQDRVEPVSPAITRDGAVSERLAERWLDSIETSRAFLFLHLAEPRAPYAPPARFAEYAPYDGEVAYADEIVGRLVKYLKSHQLYDSSTIILTAGFGEGLGSHGEMAHGLLVYDDTVRVPLIVKQAAGESAGRRVTDLAQHVDLMPTILDLAKAPAPDGLQGLSLTPLFEGSRRFAPRLVYSESLLGHYHFGWSPVASLTDGRYRFIRMQREELYDLQADPEQHDNIAADRPGVAAELRTALDRLLEGVGIEPLAALPPFERGRIEALGYVGAADLSTAAEDTQSDPREQVSTLNAYRAAVDHDIHRRWPQAIGTLQSLAQAHATSGGYWAKLAEVAERADRLDVATEAHARVMALEPGNAGARVSGAFALLKIRRLDDAARLAEEALELGGQAGTLAGSAHEVLARIALARHDGETAREHAARALDAEPTRPLPAVVDGRLLMEQRRFDEALALFEQAATDLARGSGRPIADLHFWTAETLVRLERTVEAEGQFREELRAFPLNTRARADLATLYHGMDRTEEAERVLSDLVRIAPTKEAFALAARTWTSFGDLGRAAAVRAEARRVLAPATQTASTSTAQH
jgi:arylsulfatase A-like enzyme/Flp pilus assembly protein TadD